MDAIISISQRIAAIQTRIAQLDPTATSATVESSSTAATATSGSVFSALLSDALGTTTATTDVGSGLSLVNSDNVPLAYVGYGNGKIPSSELSTIDGTSHQMWAPAARSFEAMREAAAADGIDIGITDSYRSYAAQVDVAARKGLYSQGGLAAVPGTSNHGWGMALDLNLSSSALTWMREHADEYGFEESVPRESWHWEYHPTH